MVQLLVDVVGGNQLPLTHVHPEAGWTVVQPPVVPPPALPLPVVGGSQLPLTQVQPVAG